MKKLLLFVFILISAVASGQNTHVYNLGTVTGNTNSVLTYAPTGDYLRDVFQRSSIGSGYATTLPNASLTFPGSAYMNVSGGNNTFGNLALYTNSGATFSPDKYMVKMGITAESNSANDGIGFGMVSVASANQSSIYVKIDLGTANSAALEVYNSNSFGTPLVTITGLTFNIHDSLLLQVVRNGPNFIYSLTNVSNSLMIISNPYTYDQTASSNYEPNLAQPGLYFFQGTQHLYLFQVIDQIQKSGNCVIGGDSIAEGYKSTGGGVNSWSYVLFNGNSLLYDIQAGVSERTADMIKRLPQIIQEHPSFVLVCIGINNGYLGTSNAAYQADIDTIATRLIAAGITPILCAVTPSNGFNASGYNTALQNVATLRSIKYVDVNTPLRIGTTINPLYSNADSLHLNNAGHSVYATTVRNACPELFQSYSQSNIVLNRVQSATSKPYVLGLDSNYNAFKIPISSGAAVPGGNTNSVQVNNGGGFYGDANFTYNPSTKLMALPTILTTSPGLQVGQLTFTPFANDNQLIISNGSYNSGIKYATSDFLEAINMNAGSIYLIAAPSGTAGNIVSPTVYKIPVYGDYTGTAKLGYAANTVWNLIVGPNSMSMLTAALPTGTTTDSVIVVTNVSGTSTFKAVAQSSIGGSSQWITTGSNIYYNTGKVGIGLTNPSLGSLHISDVGGANTGLYIASTGTGTGTYTQIVLANNNADIAQHFLTNSTYTPSGIFAASQYSILNTGAGGMNFIQDNAAGHIKFVVGGVTIVGLDINAAGQSTFGGNVIPLTNVTYDLGSTSLNWRNLYSQHLTSTATGGTFGGGSLGSGATNASSGSDQSGIIDVTTGTGPGTNATLMTVTFGNSFAYPNGCRITLTPANANAAALSGATQVFIGSTATTNWTMKSGSSALANSTQYQWYYHVFGF